jgi:hypothetical protein
MSTAKLPMVLAGVLILFFPASLISSQSDSPAEPAPAAKASNSDKPTPYCRGVRSYLSHRVGPADASSEFRQVP